MQQISLNFGMDSMCLKAQHLKPTFAMAADKETLIDNGTEVEPNGKLEIRK